MFYWFDFDLTLVICQYSISTVIDMSYQINMSCNCCGKKDLKDVSALLKVMAEPNRLKLLCRLSKCECCVCEVEKDFSLSQNLISHHLKVLRDAGLVTFKKDGQWKHYSVNKAAIKDFKKLLVKILENGCSSDCKCGCRK